MGSHEAEGAESEGDEDGDVLALEKRHAPQHGPVSPQSDH